MAAPDEVGHHSLRVRLGLCCIFREQPIKFRITTAAVLARLDEGQRQIRLSELCRNNAESLVKALEYCATHGIGAFRILSQILPLKTHPEFDYRLEELPDGEATYRVFLRAGAIARRHDIRLSFHPDQFIVLNSPREDVVRSSLKDLEYQAEVAEWVGADVINVHAGGAYGDKSNALTRLVQAIERLSPAARERLTLENDDRTFTPSDLLTVCREHGIPLVYDVHHHRVNPDGLSVDEATELAVSTWNREPLFHISSPIAGWNGPHPERHHDYVDPADFPDAWLHRPLTVEVEAKAKELAVLRLREELVKRATPRACPA